MSSNAPAHSTAAAGLNPLWVLALASFTSMASMRACDALLPKLALDFQTTTGVAAQTISAFAIAYGALQIFFGPMGDRHGKPPVIAWAVVCCALGNLAIALAPNLSATIALRATVGAASGGIVPLSVAYIGDTVAYEQRQETLARLSLATILGMIAGQWLGGLVADAWGWRAVFFGLSATFAAATWPLFATVRRAVPVAAAGAKGSSFTQQLRQVLASGWARTVLLITAIEGAFAFAAFAFVPSHLHHAFGLTLGQAGGVMALYGAGGIGFALSARWFIRRLGERGLVRIGGSAMGVAMAALAFADHWVWALPACLLAGVGFYMLHSTLQTHATQMLPQVRGTAVSMFVVCLFGGQSLGVAVAAAVVDALSPRWVFGASMVVLPLLGWGFAAALTRRTAPHRIDPGLPQRAIGN